MTFEPGQAVEILYTNWRGETAVRRIIPARLWFGETEWHPGSQWLLDAVDLDKLQGSADAEQATRSFAVNDISSWKPILA